MTNTFMGRIVEFPGIAVDRFNLRAQVYLLTHCHDDHLMGFANKSFQSNVYCSDITKRLLKLNDRYKDKIAFLKPVQFNKPFVVKANDQEVRVTLISSYHCPGSGMFLIEGASKNVLVTGDLRAEEWWRLKLAGNPYLMPYVYGMRTLDNIYIDTSFCQRGEPYIDITPNSEGTAAVLKLLQLYPKNDPEIQFHFADLTLGFDEVWSKISTQLDANFSMNHSTKQQMKLLHDVFDNKLYCGLLKQTGGSLEISLGYCQTQTKPKFKVRIKQCIDFNIVDLIGSLYPIRMLSLTTEEREKELEWVGSTEMNHDICKFQDRLWLLYNEMLLPSDIKLIFSRHSSYTEAKNFIAMFNPREVYPCVTSPECWPKGFLMSRLFGEVCHNNTPDGFAYDLKIMYEQGLPEETILKRPIAVINRWNYDHCERELHFVYNYIQSRGEKLPVRGQAVIGSFSEHNDLFRERIKDLQIGTIINGRGEAKFRRFIEESQRLYRKLLRVTDPEKVLAMNEAISKAGAKVSSPGSEYNERTNSSSSEASHMISLIDTKTSDPSSNQEPQPKRAKLVRRASHTALSISHFETPTFRLFVSFSQGSLTNSSMGYLEVLVVGTEPNEDKVNDICARLRHHPDDYFGFNITTLQ